MDPPNDFGAFSGAPGAWSRVQLSLTNTGGATTYSVAVLPITGEQPRRTRLPDL